MVFSETFGTTHCLHPDDKIFHVNILSGRDHQIVVVSAVVECLAQDRGVAGSSLTGGTALCP